jgi:hypothetical protein
VILACIIQILTNSSWNHRITEIISIAWPESCQSRARMWNRRDFGALGDAFAELYIVSVSICRTVPRGVSCGHILKRKLCSGMTLFGNVNVPASDANDTIPECPLTISFALDFRTKRQTPDRILFRNFLLNFAKFARGPLDSPHNPLTFTIPICRVRSS